MELRLNNIRIAKLLTQAVGKDDVMVTQILIKASELSTDEMRELYRAQRFSGMDLTLRSWQQELPMREQQKATEAQAMPVEPKPEAVDEPCDICGHARTHHPEDAECRHLTGLGDAGEGITCICVGWQAMGTEPTEAPPTGTATVSTNAVEWVECDACGHGREEHQDDGPCRHLNDTEQEGVTILCDCEVFILESGTTLCAGCDHPESSHWTEGGCIERDENGDECECMQMVTLVVVPPIDEVEGERRDDQDAIENPPLAPNDLANVCVDCGHSLLEHWNGGACANIVEKTGEICLCEVFRMAASNGTKPVDIDDLGADVPTKRRGRQRKEAVA